MEAQAQLRPRSRTSRARAEDLHRQAEELQRAGCRALQPGEAGPWRQQRTAQNRESQELQRRRSCRPGAGAVPSGAEDAAPPPWRRKQILDQLWERYELSHSDAQAQRVELESVPKATRRIGELKRDITALGTPNIGAIEEYRPGQRPLHLSVRPAGTTWSRPRRSLTGVIDEHHPADDGDLRPAVQAPERELPGRPSWSCSAAARPGWSWRMRRTSWTAASRSRCSPRARQLKTIYAALRRRKGLRGHRPVLCHSEGPPHALLRDGRDRGRPGRGQRGALRPLYAPHRRKDPVHRHHPPAGHHGGGRCALRRDHAGAGRQPASSPSISTTWQKS